MMEEKPSFGESKKINTGDLVQWRHWDETWRAIIGVVTSIRTTRLAGRRVVLAKVIVTGSETTRVPINQEIEISPLSLKILSVGPIDE
jgi:hypothetical protein